MNIEPAINLKKISETEPGEIAILSYGGEELLVFIYDDILENGQQFKGFIRIQSLKNQNKHFDYITEPPLNSLLFSLEKNYEIKFNPFNGFSIYGQGIREKPGIILVTKTSKFLCVGPSAPQHTSGFYNLDTGRLEGTPEDVVVGCIFNWKISIFGSDETKSKTLNEITFNIEKPE